MRIARSRLALLLVIMVVASGCATTTTAQQDAFKTLKTIRAGVEATLTVFNAGYQAGTYTDAQRDQLKVLYTKYLAADKVAAEALDTTLSSDPATIVSKVTVVAADVIRFVQSLKGTP